MHDRSEEVREKRGVLQRLSTAPVALSLVAPLITVILAASGWLYKQGATDARIVTLEQRVTKLEQTYVPDAVHVEKDRLRDEEFQEMKRGHEELQRRLERIETKLDAVEAAMRKR